MPPDNWSLAVKNRFLCRLLDRTIFSHLSRIPKRPPMIALAEAPIDCACRNNIFAWHIPLHQPVLQTGCRFLPSSWKLDLHSEHHFKKQAIVILAGAIRKSKE